MFPTHNGGWSCLMEHDRQLRSVTTSDFPASSQHCARDLLAIDTRALYKFILHYITLRPAQWYDLPYIYIYIYFFFVIHQCRSNNNNYSNLTNTQDFIRSPVLVRLQQHMV